VQALSFVSLCLDELHRLLRNDAVRAFVCMMTWQVSHTRACRRVTQELLREVFGVAVALLECVPPVDVSLLVLSQVRVLHVYMVRDVTVCLAAASCRVRLRTGSVRRQRHARRRGPLSVLLAVLCEQRRRRARRCV
jgi:hypothetical protein